MLENDKFETAVSTLASMCIDQKMGSGVAKECFISNLRLFADQMEQCTGLSKKMTLLESLKKHKAHDPDASAWLAGLSKKRFNELKHKGWDWVSFYNGWIEGLHESVNALTDNLDSNK